MNSIYKCPVCSKKLTKTANIFSCAEGHSYDIAKQGYVNLLLANQKNSKEPGDSKAMIENRTNFLEQGYYDKLSDKMNKIISEWIDKSPGDQKINILDLGCGEGFYATQLQKNLDTKHTTNILLHGIDISKSAIQKAAKRDSKIQFCIASNFLLPYLNESIDIIFSIFSPFESKEILRVLKPGGKIIVVRPGPSHLQKLASLLYEKFELQGDTEKLPHSLGLKPLQTLNLTYQIHLINQKEIHSLIGMTPYYWTLNEAKKQLLSQQKELTTEVDFQISLFQK